MTKTNWPKGFTRGLPDREGLYACIVKHEDIFMNYGFAVELCEIIEYGKLAADELGIEPGLHVTDLDGCTTSIADYGIVGYHRICDSAWPIMTAKEFTEE